MSADAKVLQGIATYDLTLLANTPFNPYRFAITVKDVSGCGVFTIHRNGTRAIESVECSLFFGTHSMLGSYVFGNTARLSTAEWRGELTNVVRDCGGDSDDETVAASNIRSGDFVIFGCGFGIEFLMGPATGVTLSTRSRYPIRFRAHPEARSVQQTASMGVEEKIVPVLFETSGGSILVGESSRHQIKLFTTPERSNLPVQVVDWASDGVGWRRPDGTSAI